MKFEQRFQPDQISNQCIGIAFNPEVMRCAGLDGHHAQPTRDRPGKPERAVHHRVVGVVARRTVVIQAAAIPGEQRQTTERQRNSIGIGKRDTG